MGSSCVHHQVLCPAAASTQLLLNVVRGWSGPYLFLFLLPSSHPIQTIPELQHALIHNVLAPPIAYTTSCSTHWKQYQAGAGISCGHCWKVLAEGCVCLRPQVMLLHQCISCGPGQSPSSADGICWQHPQLMLIPTRRCTRRMRWELVEAADGPGYASLPGTMQQPESPCSNH